MRLEEDRRGLGSPEICPFGPMASGFCLLDVHVHFPCLSMLSLQKYGSPLKAGSQSY